jgi:2-C-methyl-D-erythritol 2,4-cyclodiphosphate synthase
MFERFSESARRIIFWSRAVAELALDNAIRPEHLLAGVYLEHPEVFSAFGLSSADLPLSTRVDLDRLKSVGELGSSKEMPLSEDSRRVLRLASEQAQQVKLNSIGGVQILSALCQSVPRLRDALRQAGLTESLLALLAAKYAVVEAQESKREARAFADQVFSGSRAGIAYDLHRLAEGRKLILGGVEIPFEKGPVGHSDGDVLSHAICDALLGAAGLGDIGTHFPDTDPQWKGASSLLFLEHVCKLLAEKGLVITHIDTVVITEKPKLGPHMLEIRTSLANSLGIDVEQINVKAKTNEGVDAIGRGEAIACHAIATLEGPYPGLDEGEIEADEPVN